MSEFEEWWKNRQMGNYLWGDFGCHRDTWKAALEWALNRDGGDLNWDYIKSEISGKKTY